MSAASEAGSVADQIRRVLAPQLVGKNADQLDEYAARLKRATWMAKTSQEVALAVVTEAGITLALNSTPWDVQREMSAYAGDESVSDQDQAPELQDDLDPLDYPCDQCGAEIGHACRPGCTVAV